MTKLKIPLMVLVVIGQLLGIAFLFFNIKLAILTFIIYGLALLGLLIILILERIKEKRDDDDHDYRNY